MLRIGERLQTVASMVPVCHTMADIGTDHGYVPACLALSGQCRRVIASDIGMQGLRTGEAETVVIAGMGGATIAGILEESPEIAASVTTFVLQPMNAAGLLRRWLTQHGYHIVEEALCKENKHIYSIIKAVHGEGKQDLSPLEEEFGPCILEKKPALWQEYIEGKSEHYRRLLRQMAASPAAVNSIKYNDLKKLLAQVDGLIHKSV